MKFAPVLLLPLLLAATINVSADEKADVDRAKVFEKLPVNEAELASARKQAEGLSGGDRELHNALRYLIKPEFEEELFSGIGRPGCYLPAMSAEAPGRLEVEELLRLWAVVESGLLDANDVAAYVKILMRTRAPNPQNSLAHSAVIMMTIRALIGSGGVQGAKKLFDLAAKVYKATEKAGTLTSLKSKRVKKSLIEPQWFANHFWRAVIARTAFNMGFVKRSSRIWETDLKVLVSVWLKETGWSSGKEEQYSQPLDLDPNLMALMSLRLAAAAPVGLLGKKARAGASDCLNDRAPAILKRLEGTYGLAGLTGSRLMLTLPLSTVVAPAGTLAKDWRTRLLAADPDDLSRDGAILSGSELFDAMDISSAAGRTWQYRRTMETPLAVIGYCGGLFEDDTRPLATDRAAAGRTLYALSILHRVGDALEPPAIDNPGAKSPARVELNLKVEKAIRRGCQFLKSQMNDNGRFGLPSENNNNRYTLGRSAICLLTLLHGGEDIASREIARALDYLESYMRKQDCGGIGTYGAGLMLAVYQAYYEPEQEATGMLDAVDAKSYRTAAKAMWAIIPKARQNIIKKLMFLLEGANAPNGGWGYAWGSRGSGYWDNSCSQYAILGYKSASLLGYEIKNKVWIDEAVRLVNQYTLLGSRGEKIERRKYRTPEQMKIDQAKAAKGQDSPEEKPAVEKKSKRTSSEKKKPRKGKKQPPPPEVMWIKPGGWAYRTGVGNMGMIASGVQGLAICRDELKIRGILTPKLDREMRFRIFGGLDAIGRIYPTLKNRRATRMRGGARRGRGNSGSLYAYYAMERAGVMSGYDLLPGEIDWYFVGATMICDGQDKALGCWNKNARAGRSDAELLGTSYAVLFLKRRALPIPTLRKPPAKPEPKPEVKRPEPKPAEPKKPITNGPKKKGTEGSPAKTK